MSAQNANKHHVKAIKDAKNKPCKHHDKVIKDAKNKAGNGLEDNDWNVKASVNAQINFEKEEADICVWEQVINAYVQFLAIREDGDDTIINILQFDREFELSAKGDHVILTSGDQSRAYDFLFTFPPEITPCKRETDCNQLVRIVENSVYVDIDAFASVLITPFTLVIAEDGNLLVLSFESLICGNDEIRNEIAGAIELTINESDHDDLKEIINEAHNGVANGKAKKLVGKKLAGKKLAGKKIKGKSACKVRLVKH